LLGFLTNNLKRHEKHHLFNNNQSTTDFWSNYRLGVFYAIYAFCVGDLGKGNFWCAGNDNRSDRSNLFLLL
jgi:hypothetical protein